MSEQQTEERTCRYPGCQRPAAPAEAGTGRPPEYCEDPKHTRAAAWRARQRRDGRDGEAETVEALPVDAARQRAGELTGQVAGMMEHLGTQLTSLVGELRTVGDLGAVEAQIEAMSTDAAERIAAANARATRAEQAQRRAEAEREEADDAAEEATGRSETLAAELEQVRAELTAAAETNVGLTEELAQTREASQEEQRRAGSELERLNTRLAEADEDAVRAGGERDQAIERAEASEVARATAEERARAAEQRLATEVERVATAEAGTDEVRGQLETVRAEAERTREAAAELRGTIATLTAERDAARSEAERERAYGEQRVQDLRTTYDSQLERMREELAQLQDGPGDRHPAAKARRGTKNEGEPQAQ
ncbi:hypothetical protein LG284_16375 (plasmid) [Citricoccus nitrophenolicus]